MKKVKPIIALDFQTEEETREFIKLFSNEQLNVKVGMELFYGTGPNFIEELVEAGHEVFLDLKCYDIPNTVQQTMKQLARLGVAMVNLHAPGGSDMMKAAAAGLNEGTEAGKERPLLIAVTQLTSSDEKTVKDEQQLAVGLDENILHLAKLTEESGLDGVVCSPLESSMIKKELHNDFLTVTPGIRLDDQSINSDDQVRIATPEKAARLGSDYIVVGRPIRLAEDPVKAYRLISEQWQKSLEGVKN